MFALSVRSLDGSCHGFSARPDTTLAEVRLKLEESLPKFHEIRLLQGTRELANHDVVEVELQAMVTPSPAKAIAKIKEVFSKIDQIVKDGDEAALDNVADESNGMLDAFSMLQEMGELAPTHCEKMLDILIPFFKMVTRVVFLRRPREWQVSVAHPIFRFAEAFGSLCTDPATYIPKLTNWSETARSDLEHALIAHFLVEIAARWGAEALPSPLQMSLKHWAGGILSNRRGVSPIASLAARSQNKFGFQMGECALRVLGVLSNNMEELDEHYGRVNTFVQNLITYYGTSSIPDHICPEALLQYATQVLEQLRTRMEDAAFANVDSEVDLAAQVPAGSGDQVGQPVDMAEPVLEAGAESDPVMIHQQDLQEAIMRSKADGPPPICYDDSMAIFRQTRCCEEAVRALCESVALDDARKRVEDAGCSLFPESANGAFLLVPLTNEQLLELDLQLDKFHILALRSDEPAIDEALRMVPRPDRPKLRDDHRAGPIKEAEGAQRISAGGSDIFEDFDLLRPEIRARIKQFADRNSGSDDTQSQPSLSTVTESAPCTDAACKQGKQLASVNPRHWK